MTILLPILHVIRLWEFHRQSIYMHPLGSVVAKLRNRLVNASQNILSK